MAIHRIRTQEEEFGLLRTPCGRVVEFDQALRDLVRDMWDSMYAARGVGLAAPQIGSSLRVAVIDTLWRPNSNRRLVLINPKITASAGEQIQSEGCLSMPGLNWPIPRAETVTVVYQDLSGLRCTLTSRSLLARAIQHECDHLDGVLCSSKAPPDDVSRTVPNRGGMAHVVVHDTGFQPSNPPAVRVVR
jgi:peptide deformylase